MIVYQNSKKGFLEDCFSRDIEDVVLRQFKARTGHRVGASEIRSWKESLLAMGKVLNVSEIPDDSSVGIEFGIPQTAKRIDFMLAGRDGENRDRLIIVELKQWAEAQVTESDGVVRTRFANGVAEVAHPSYQAWSYASLLESFNEFVYSQSIGLSPCAYLHNYGRDGAVTDAFYAHYLELAPAFLSGDQERERLRDFIARHVRYGDRRNLIYSIEQGRIRPSKGLVDSLVGMLRGKEEFVLVDDQKIVFEAAMRIGRAASDTGKKSVLIVEGGPGTGKSVVAINLLAALTAERRTVQYVTKNAAPRAVFEKTLTGSFRRTQVSNLFSGSGAFTSTKANTFDALIVDEAHRLNEKSGLYGNMGTNQIEEIIGSARFSVFFIDEDQRVTWKDIGEKAEIARIARKQGASVSHMELSSQFRCSGSNGYLAWLDSVLDIRSTANEVLDSPDEFDFRVLDSPTELRNEIVRRNRERNRARMVAGYCWDWASKRDPSAYDVVIPEHAFAMRWNLARDGSAWIIAPESVTEIGCIHTCQGLEVDYVGVIIGGDLVFSDGKVTVVPTARSRHDQSLKGYHALKRVDRSEAERRAALIIKNTYRTLMTRGMKGCYVYCIDAALRDYLRSKIRIREPVALSKVAEPGVGAYHGE